MRLLEESHRFRPHRTQLSVGSRKGKFCGAILWKGEEVSFAREA